MCPCTEVGYSCSGHYEDLQALNQNKAGDSTWTHCLIHREALVTNYLNKPGFWMCDQCNKLHKNMKILCDDKGAKKYASLFYYCPLQWLSCGNILTHTSELYNCTLSLTFFEEEKTFQNFVWKIFSKILYGNNVFNKTCIFVYIFKLI